MSNDLNEHFDLPMISIKRTIEKLFGDEQFERAQHINFVIELLSSQQTDNCLDGLNLDCFDNRCRISVKSAQTFSNFF